MWNKRKKGIRPDGGGSGRKGTENERKKLLWRGRELLKHLTWRKKRRRRNKRWKERDVKKELGFILIISVIHFEKIEKIHYQRTIQKLKINP